ncbi:substrate-binding domain-containing protein [Kineococcus rhizosphaerae]|uniref:substrate-binding domain-containing protein n=1 Tax=Kineococcus rhizosphaerae TaxID=559628 RepID=UPI001FE34205|nr:substrate-binding domain-containing protein [Kineococcus rhizosphaerae]
MQGLEETRRIVGVVVPSAASPYFGEMLEGIDAEATRTNITLLLSMSTEDANRELRAVQALLQRDVDAIILVPSSGWRERTRPLLKNSRTAVILADRLEDQSFDQVGAENTHASQAIVSHLISAGRSRIAMIGGLSGLSTSREREEGFRLAHKKHGLIVDDALLWNGQSTVQGGMRAATQMLRTTPRPDAVFCANNNMTLGLLAALHKEDVGVPKDLALVSFDDLEWGDILVPGITAVAQPFHAVGSQAVRLAVSRWLEPDRPPQTLRLPPSIEHRESCGCELARLGSRRKSPL